MGLDSKTDVAALARHGLLLLRDRAGDHIECRQGELWLTQEGDLRDIVLEAGDSFTLDRKGTAIVHALSDSLLSIRPRARSAAPARAGSPESRAAA